MRKLLAALTVLALSFLILCEFTLPGMAGRVLENQLFATSLKPRRVEVRVLAFPAAKLLLGRFDGISLQMRGVTLAGCQASLLAFQVPRGSCDWRKTLEGDLLSSLKTAAPIKARLVFSQDDLNRYLSGRELGPVSEPGLKLEDGRVRLTGRLGLLGSRLSLQVSGQFRLVPGGQLSFNPEEIWLEGESLPGDLARKLASQLTLKISPESLPYPFKVEQVDARPGMLVITGECL